MGHSARSARCTVCLVSLLALLGVAIHGTMSSAFLPATRLGGLTAELRARPNRGGATRLYLTQSEYEMQKRELKEAEAAMYPEELMWVKPDENRLIEVYPGARSFETTFWAVVIPAMSLGFFIFGISTGLEKPLVDYLPIEKQWTEFLRPPPYIFWDFQGMAMTAVGSIGLIFLAPSQLFTAIANPGYGRIEIDKEKRTVRMVLDGHCVASHIFEEVKNVHLIWDNAANLKMVGESPQTLSLQLKNGDELGLVPFEGYCSSKRIMERRAAELAAFMEVELLVTDM